MLLHRRRVLLLVLVLLLAEFELVELLFGLVLGHIKMRVDDLRDWLDLSAQLLLDLVQGISVVISDEIDSNTQMTESTRSANTVQVGLGHFGEIEVDDHVDGLDINTASKQVRADQVTASTVAEIVEDTVSVLLTHLGVDVEARVAEFGDLLGEQLDSLGRVTEDDRLIDLQLREESVQAVDLLLLLDIRIVLSDTLKSELLHQIDLIRVVHVLLDELVDGARESSRVEKDLSVGREIGDDRVEHVLEVLGEELVGLVHDEHGARVHDGEALLHEIEDTAWRGDDHVHLLLQTHDVLLEVRAASGRHHLAAHVLAQLDADLARLQRELACWHDYERLDFVLRDVDALEDRDHVRACLSGAVLGASQDVAASQCDWDARLLDGRWSFPALLENAHQELSLETVVLEFMSLSGSDISSFNSLVLWRQVQLVLPASCFV